MIDSKLTLKLNTASINRAKVYSGKHGISLSAMVEKFFDGLTLDDSQNEKNSFEYSPIVSELAGILSLPEDYDYKSDYLEHLEKKYE